MTRFAATVAVLFLLASGRAEAQFFTDNFEDGSATDGMPVTWTPEPPFDTGEFNVVGGDFLITPGPVPSLGPDWFESDAFVADRVFGDVTVKTQVRALGSGRSHTGVVVLSDFSSTSLWAAIRDDGRMIVGAFNDEFEDLWEATSQVSPIQMDVNLQFTVSDDAAEFYAWAVGGEKPSAPQLVVPNLPDYLLTEGHVGVFVASGSRTTQSTPSAYRWFAAVPEPSTFALTTLAFLAVLCPVCRSRHSRA